MLSMKLKEFRGLLEVAILFSFWNNKSWRVKRRKKLDGKRDDYKLFL